MSDYDRHNKAFNYDPPQRTGSATGGLMVVGGIIAFVILAMLLVGNGPGPAPEEGAAAPAVAPANGAPAVEAPLTSPTAPAIVE